MRRKACKLVTLFVASVNYFPHTYRSKTFLQVHFKRTMAQVRDPKDSGSLLTANSDEQRLNKQTSQTPGLPEAWGFVLLVCQLALVVFLTERFRLEDLRFHIVVRAAAVAFVIHHLLPLRLRLAFFSWFSVGVIGYYLGLEQGAWDWKSAGIKTGAMILLGGMFVGACHLKISFASRVLTLLVMVIPLAYLRTTTSVFDGLWPMLGGMFMFRLMIYLYDIQHSTEPFQLSRTVAYFFLFPNLWLYVFPVIDYRAFTRLYFNDKPLAIYQKGISWMLRGVFHLLLWRLIYYQIYIDPTRVIDGSTLAQFLLSNMALYLRVSGQFHFVIGLLHLFGFNLPETNRHYFLASSITDYWRRVNIYWKDFIMKVFYYPAVVRLKRWGTSGSVIGATVFAFFVTWFLHSYQWFWLRGAFPLEAKDFAFWGLLGVLVCTNSLWELKRGRKRSLGQRQHSWREWTVRVAQTGATFIVITVLWSIWSCDSLAQWAGIWQHADHQTVAFLGAAILTLAAAMLLLEKPWVPAAKGLRKETYTPLPLRHVFVSHLVPIGLLLALTSGRVTAWYPAELQVATLSVFLNTPNKSDEEYMVRGYYENLMDASRFGTQLDTAQSGKPQDWAILENTPAMRDTRDLRIKELVPNTSLVVNGKRIRINSAGLRDQEYSLQKPAGAYRIALLGSSIVMGWNIEEEERFETLIEQQINAQREPAEGPFEVINFAVNGYSAVSLVDVLHKRALAYQPDAVVFVSHREDSLRSIDMLVKALRMGAEVRYPFLQDIITRSGLGPNPTRAMAQRKLAPYVPEIVRWAYREVAQACRERGIVPLWVYLPGVLHRDRTEEDERHLKLAEEAGFQTITLFGIYGEAPPERLMVAPWDAHPNAAANRIIARELSAAFKELRISHVAQAPLRRQVIQSGEKK